jgi:ribonuclease HI
LCFFSNKLDTNGLNKKYLNTLKIYCDGSCLNNGKSDYSQQALGIGVHFPSHCEFDISKGFHKEPNTKLTNNQAELLAALFSLKQASKIIEQYPETYKKIVIHTDSKYVVQGMNVWSIKWVKNNWKNSNDNVVVNKDRFLEIMKEREKLKEIKVIWKHVKGHDGDSFNETAHKLAFSASKDVISGKKEEIQKDFITIDEKEILGGVELKNQDSNILKIYFGSLLSVNGESEILNQALGIGIHFPSHKDYDISVADSVSNFSNYEAEIIAALFSLKQAQKIIKKYPKIYKKIEFNTNNNYIVQAMNVWIIKWVEKNWKGSSNKAILNKYAFKVLYKELEKLKDIEVTWNHVQKNDKESLNQVANNLANNAVSQVVNIKGSD